MSREIKFRALCTPDGEERMVYFGMQQMDNGVFAWPMPDDISHIDEYISPLMQFTGLKDKNGKEIYEGDVVVHIQNEKSKKDKNIVEWGEAGFIFKNNGKEGGHRPFINSLGWCPYIVLGNIYENPELIK